MWMSVLMVNTVVVPWRYSTFTSLGEIWTTHTLTATQTQLRIVPTASAHVRTHARTHTHACTHTHTHTHTRTHTHAHTHTHTHTHTQTHSYTVISEVRTSLLQCALSTSLLSTCTVSPAFTASTPLDLLHCPVGEGGE